MISELSSWRDSTSKNPVSAIHLKKVRYVSWIILLIASVFEVCGAVFLKYAEGFTRFYPSLLACISMVLSLGFLGLALRVLPLGTAYAIWTGLGTIGTV